ncbi:MAG: UDP-N-acetylmuramate dehydrogenase [Acidobacteriota bacterium]|nr:UDP-N-acetylmuramate dehydrogenase [Acidobacteriota bacterium]
MQPPTDLHDDVLLSALTSLAVGGPARFFTRFRTPKELSQAVTWAREEGHEVFLLGGGSNLLVADDGFDGLVLQSADDRLELSPDGRLQAGAAVPWDHIVELAVHQGMAGIECLSGIPGSAGAAPIQNIGAYGQELSEVAEEVQVLELATGEKLRLPAQDCGFGYRTSAFKTRWRGRYAVTGITLQLRPGAPGTVGYPDLQRSFRNHGGDPTPVAVRQQVLEIRRGKSMVLTLDDPNHRSAGSFFVNPVLGVAEVATVERRVRARQGNHSAESMPRYPMPPGPDGEERIKLSAAWLIESAGFRRGHSLGPAGISSRHALALINRGEATAADLVALAARIRRRVRGSFGVVLEPEPTFLGFQRPVEELLD